MKMRKTIPSLIMLTLSVTSCGENSNNPIIHRNGDLLSLSEITYDNAFVNATAELLGNMLSANEPFLFYVTSSECSHCYDFESVILDYVKSTKNYVLKLEVYEDDTNGDPIYTEEFKNIYDEYKNYFFVNGQLLTPSVFVTNGFNFATSIPSSRFANSGMFSRAMNDYIKYSNVYAISSIEGNDSFNIKHDDAESMTILIDRSNKELMTTYNLQIQEITDSSSFDIALVDINGSNKDELLKKYELDSLDRPIAIYKNGSNFDKYIFNSKIDSGKEFLKQYIK